jgi:predicted DsbA family dithiol-disulfide isomerase
VSETLPLKVDVVSDVVCPWCFIGKRRLETAMADIAVPLEIRWRPFQLDPTIPPEGKDRRAYLAAKFGTTDRVRQMQDRLVEAGEEEGIPFAFERIKVSPNTLDAHRLIHWAGESGKQERIVDALFRAYFLEGRDIGDHAVLADTAAAVGMDRAEVAPRLASGEDRASVRAEIAAAQQMGVTGVPTFILLGRYALVGAQPAAELARAFETLAERQAEAADA